LRRSQRGEPEQVPEGHRAANAAQIPQVAFEIRLLVSREPDPRPPDLAKRDRRSPPGAPRPGPGTTCRVSRQGHQSTISLGPDQGETGGSGQGNYRAASRGQQGGFVLRTNRGPCPGGPGAAASAIRVYARSGPRGGGRSWAPPGRRSWMDQTQSRLHLVEPSASERDPGAAPGGARPLLAGQGGARGGLCLEAPGQRPLAIECKWSADGFRGGNLRAFRTRHPEGENLVIYADPQGNWQAVRQPSSPPDCRLDLSQSRREQPTHRQENGAGGTDP
jgi:hypothetical protein